MNYAEQTKYPQIFRRTYWGAFDGICDPVIVNNRNEMVELFNIQYMIRRKSGKHNVWAYLDHAEFYRVSPRIANNSFTNKMLLVTSRYANDDLSRFGFAKMPSIYTPNARSWCRIFFAKNEYRQCIKNIADFIDIRDKGRI